MKRLLTFATAALIAVPALFAQTERAEAWWGAENSDLQIMEQLDTLLAEANRAVPLPGIVNFFERRMVKMLYELRDNPEFRTYTYIVTMDGTFIKICDSLGFGINASIQFSNPVRPADISQTPVKDYTGFQLALTPQAEPNGLFMPEGLAATYAICLHPEDGEIAAVYMEPDMISSPFPFKAIDARTGEVTTE